MEIRKDKAEFLEKLLKVFNDVRVIRMKDLEAKFKNDTYLLVQTEKHLKILERDGMIRKNVLDEYYLEPLGIRTINDLENLGYLAKHKKEEAEWRDFDDEEDEDTDWTSIDILSTAIHLITALR